MDLLSHALVGSLIASVGLQKKYGLVATATVVAASLLPDVDSVFTVLGPRYFFQYHRHPLAHSIGGAVLLSSALTAIVYLATPLKRPGLVFGVSLGAMILHLLGDLLTPWPIPVFHPFSTKTYSLDLIYFLDPFLLAVFASSYLASLRWSAKGMAILALTLVVTVGYWGFRAYARQTAMDVVADNVSIDRAATLPHGLSMVAWDVIAKQDDGYTYYVVDSIKREVRSNEVIRSMRDERAVTAASQSVLVQVFLKRARFPVTFVMKEGNGIAIEWRDVHLMIGGGAVRGVKVLLDDQGKIIEEKFELSTGE